VRIRDRIAQGIFVVAIVASLAMFAMLAKPVFELEPHTDLIPPNGGIGAVSSGLVEGLTEAAALIAINLLVRAAARRRGGLARVLQRTHFKLTLSWPVFMIADLAGLLLVMYVDEQTLFFLFTLMAFAIGNPMPLIRPSPPQ
jgi:hypothetical protein